MDQTVVDRGSGASLGRIGGIKVITNDANHSESGYVAFTLFSIKGGLVGLDHDYYSLGVVDF